uniref:Receptor ligand binding region domain-containing protein n=1 Tax=Panagrolaimus davidi TaxID=227884 RepID=A0A914QSL0_9BILA
MVLLPGIIQGTESISWHNTRHAIDEWNNANAFKSEITFSLIAPSEGRTPSDDKVCDVIQRKVSAIIICPETESIDEILLIYSMCDRFKIPCITTSTVAPLSHSRFVTSIAPKDDLVGKAAAALIQNLGWDSFLLTYQDSQGLLCY